MAVSYTTTYNLTKPEVGASEDAWGGLLNTNFDNIDDLLDGTTAITGIDINSGTLDGVTIGGTTAGAGTFTNLTATGTTTLAGASTSADITFGDNDKAIFGAGSDLQIYHDGSDSFITDTGAGNLQIWGGNFRLRSSDGSEAVIDGNSGGAVTLYYDNAAKLATTSTGVDITGTLTSDGLTVFQENPKITITDTGTGADHELNGASSIGNLTLNFDKNDDGSSPYFYIQHAGNKLAAFRKGGDISFYEDTGTTAKFFWDASAESLGIGTSSVSDPLHIKATRGIIRLEPTAVGGTTYRIRNGISGGSEGGISFYDVTNAATRLAIDSSGNVGIGTTSPLYTFHTQMPSDGSTGAAFRYLGGTNNPGLFLSVNESTTDVVLNASGSTSANLVFSTTTERMRIDSSGNLLVGKTTTALATTGSYIAANGLTALTTDSQRPLILNRKTNDGDLIEFNKDGSGVGSIGTWGGGFFVGSPSATDAYLYFGNSYVAPSTTSGFRDNAIDLGNGSARFDDVYATNGTIQTSDRNEKQDIAELSDAEQRVAVACKGLLRKFRWIDAVAEKGDDARIHFGIIAQDLQDAFTAEGLDAGDYAMFIHTTWTDEETGEERSRMGVRYSELLAFIIAAI